MNLSGRTELLFLYQVQILPFTSRLIGLASKDVESHDVKHKGFYYPSLPYIFTEYEKTIMTLGWPCRAMHDYSNDSSFRA